MFRRTYFVRYVVGEEEICTTLSIPMETKKIDIVSMVFKEITSQCLQNGHQGTLSIKSISRL